MITLRPYQQTLFDGVQAAMRSGVRSVLAVSPCGSGKTVIFSYMASVVSGKGMRNYIVAHRDELLDQISGTLGDFGVAHSFIAAGRPYDKRLPVQVCSVMTLAGRLAKQAAKRYHPGSSDYIYQPNLFTLDEAHHAVAGSWGKVFDLCPEAFKAGFTATPERLDGKGLGDRFQHMVRGPGVRELIDMGALSDYRLFAPGGIDVRAVHSLAGDFNKGELAKAADRPSITGDAVAHYRRLAAGKRAIVYCVSVVHSEHVAEQFRAAGFAFYSIDGTMAPDVRKDLVRKFRAGIIQGLTSVDLVSEGFDLPAIEVAIMLRPTQSLGLWIQQSSRALRPFEGKAKALILDHAGNCERLGMPDDERKWTLEGRRGKGREGDGPVAQPTRTCPKCFAVYPIYVQACSYVHADGTACGHKFEAQAREIEHKDGELVEVDTAAVRAQRKDEERACKTEQELYELGVRRKYKFPRAWAHHTMQRRQAWRLQQGRAA